VFASHSVVIALVPLRTVVPYRGQGIIEVTGDYFQTLAVIGLSFLQPLDPALPSALVLQRVLGDDHLEARLHTELHVKRRIAYSARLV
jgi:hypothetical protein